MIYSGGISENYEFGEKISTNNLIALCKLKDKYIMFCNDLEKIIKSEKKNNLIYSMYQAMLGRKIICPKKYKDFIKKYEDEIDIMKATSSLWDFTLGSYDLNGNQRKGLSYHYFYEYLEKNQRNISTINDVVLKIKNLGFNEIILRENQDFTKIEYQLDNSYRRDSCFYYLENIEIEPTYLKNQIKYKTTDSCYSMYLETRYDSNIQEISKRDREIVLNTLIFDPNRLPEYIDANNTIGEITRKANEKDNVSQDIRDTIDLDVSIDDLSGVLKTLMQIDIKSENIKDKRELKEILGQIQDRIVRLREFEKEMSNQIIKSNESITDEIISKEKKLYLDRRYWGRIDID